jgi:hypothetical protein
MEKRRDFKVPALFFLNKEVADFRSGGNVPDLKEEPLLFIDSREYI